MRKLSLALALALACLATVGGAGAVAKSGGTKLTIRSWPGGVFGYLGKVSERCGEGRKVVLFERQGEKRDPGSDPRVAVDRSAASSGRYQWSVPTWRTGPLYAQVPAIKGCAAVLSSVVVFSPLVGTGGDNTDYPQCSPYVSEGPSPICRLDQIYYDFDQEAAFTPCRFGDSTGNCPGRNTGPFPWGTNASGGRARSRVYWRGTSNRAITFVSFPSSEAGGNGSAHLGGTLPSPGSPRFMVDDAFAQNDAGYPNGNHFYTPNLPGQDAGEVGGPLALNFQNGSGTDFGAQAWISGYLFLKR